ncbi:MAG: pilus assembly protein [Acidobacteria bacterium]|nr:pilus assembly protein [Acidobacteriota bacterium]
MATGIQMGNEPDRGHPSSGARLASAKWKHFFHAFCKKSLLRQLRETCGAELYEFAVALPLLLVLVVSIVDFARAYNTKQILVNATRGAARLMASTALSNSSCPSNWTSSNPGNGTPCAVEAAADSVENYLSTAGLNAATCLSSSTPAYSTPMTWTYSCSNVTLVINKAYVITGGADGGVISSTKVTLSYPHTFFFGTIIGLLVNGATGISGQHILTADATMQNFVLN